MPYDTLGTSNGSARVRRWPPGVVLFGVLVTFCGALVAFALLSSRPPGAAASSADETDALGITYASRLTNGTSASNRTRLFSAPNDRAGQLAALREDDMYASDDPEHTVAYAENKALFAVCNEGTLGDALQCSGQNGFILHVALRGDARASAAAPSAELDRYGARWAQIFERYHPRNNHCALVILASDVTAEDDADNDDDGNGIIQFRCYR